MITIEKIANFAQRAKKIESSVKSVENFPKEGILFRDVASLVSSPEAFKETVDMLYELYRDEKIDVIVAADARGFIFGSALAYRLGVGMVMARKKGKLPGRTISADYELEYGSATLQLQEHALKKGDRALLIDDLLATGGTAGAIIELVRQLEAEIVNFCFVVELYDLGGANYLKNKYNVDSVSFIKFPGH